jgi:hypothetical protein
MKTKALVATLLMTAAASAEARFAWPYPPKTVSPDEIGHWVVINGNAWPDNAEPELTSTKQGQRFKSSKPFRNSMLDGGSCVWSACRSRPINNLMNLQVRASRLD